MMRRLLWLHGSSPKRYQHRVGLNYRIKTYQRMLNTNVHDYVGWEPSADSKDIILFTPLHLELRAAAWLIPKNGPKLVTTAVVIVIVIVVVEEWVVYTYRIMHLPSSVKGWSLSNMPGMFIFDCASFHFDSPCRIIKKVFTKGSWPSLRITLRKQSAKVGFEVCIIFYRTKGKDEKLC